MVLVKHCIFDTNLSNIIDSDFNKVAVIVTNGISLQEQLYYKDTPLINKIMKLNNPDADFNVALLKGNKFCLCKQNERPSSRQLYK